MGVSYKQRAYDHIRDKLMVGELAAGCRLSNRALAREIGISIIPVREAISQLVSEGLLEHKPRVGTFVVEPSRQEIAELCELREALEAYAASRAAERISDGELAEMQRCCDAMDVILEEVAQSGWDSARSDRWRLADAQPAGPVTWRANRIIRRHFPLRGGGGNLPDGQVPGRTWRRSGDHR